jgi:predicted NUDIX family NTP pyrophosphohydrolase
MRGMAKVSAGILLFRRGAHSAHLEIFLVHPGGPFWKSKDLGAWSIPKGMVSADEEALAAAKREFHEETGWTCPEGNEIDLGEIRMGSGKRVRCWAVEGEVDASRCRSNFFELEWPPRSGKLHAFPEADQWQYYDAADAKRKINPHQAALIDRLIAVLGEE